MRRLVVPALLGVLVLVGAGMAVWPDHSAAASSVGTRPATTPVLSARRVPRAIAGLVGDRRLTQALDTALADPALGGARGQSCLVVDDGGRTLYSRNAEQPLLPASNMKLVTAETALQVLGPNKRFVTEVRGAVGPGGVVSGNLFLVGSGDPLLQTGDYMAADIYGPHLYTPIEELARRVAAAGVKVVQGGVIGDETRYDIQRYIPSWEPDYRADNEIGPLGALAANGGFVKWRPVALAAVNPAAEAASLFTQLLRAQGVTVGAPAGVAVTPPRTPVVATIQSPPMADIVGEMLRESDNFTAELLLKEIGRVGAGAGTTAAGAATVRRTLTRLGLPLAAFHSVDGSGLDRSDRLTCGLLLRLLAHDGPNSTLARALPVAHRDGTLKKRFVSSPAAGRLRAKTGSLDGVSGLSGFVTARRGTLTFSLLLNGLPADALGPRLWERTGAALVAWPDAPDPAGLAPLQ